MDKDCLPFEEALSHLSERMRTLLSKLPVSIKKQTQEIRMRTGAPLQIGADGQVYFISSIGKILAQKEGAFICTKEDLQENFRSLCAYSVHSHIEEIKQGFVSTKGGHRAGICGTAVLEKGTLMGVRDISSINLRIARQILGAADEIIPIFSENPQRGILLVGPPSSGKTTILRDLARQLSYGKLGYPIKVAAIDERGELAGVCNGQPQNDLGPCCDILDGYPKADAMMIALRTLSPDVMICDELGTLKETEAVEMSLNSGVAVIASIHASSLAEIQSKSQIKRLLQTGAFAKVVLLDNRKRVGRVKSILSETELLMTENLSINT